MLPYKLNDRQIQAVKASFESPLIISAGPGSGKVKDPFSALTLQTLTLVCRTLNMIASGINPGNILVISFTRKAAQEMGSRMERLCSSAAALTIVTFHRFCLGVLRSNKSLLPDTLKAFKVQSRAEIDRILR